MTDHPAAFVSGLRRERSTSPATVRALTQDLAILVRLTNGATWAELRPADIRSFVASEHRRGLAPASLRRMLSSWRKFFTHLADLGLLEHNPVIGIRAPRSGTALPKALSPDEANILLAQTPASYLEVRDAAMFETAYSSALRVSELVALDCADIDLNDRKVNVRHGKGDRHRIVPLGTHAIAAIQAWFQVRRTLDLPLQGPLFTNNTGRRLTTRSAQLRLKILAQKAGLPGNITPHMLRHSCASHLLQSSGDLRSVQEMLGHADVSSTQIYTHLDFQALAKVYDVTHPRARRTKNK